MQDTRWVDIADSRNIPGSHFYTWMVSTSLQRSGCNTCNYIPLNPNQMYVQFNFPLTGSQYTYGHSNVTWPRGILSEGLSAWKEIVVLTDCDQNTSCKFYSNIWVWEKAFLAPSCALEGVCVGEGPWNLSSINFIVYPLWWQVE